MKGKRQRSLIGKLSGLLTPVGSGLYDVLSSPNKEERSPRGVAAQFDPGAVGLGIVAVLGKSSPKNAALFRPVDRRSSEVQKLPNPTRRKEVGVLPALQFLSSCDLCGKKLHGRDVYMYRGEMAFCSADCRSNHMMNDERKDKHCRSETPKAVDLSPCSPYAKDQIFSAGILAI